MSTSVEIRGDGRLLRVIGSRPFVFAMVVLALVALIATLVFHFTGDDSTAEMGLVGWTVAAVLLGALLAIRVPGNAVGATLLMTGVVGAVSGATLIFDPTGATELNVVDSIVMGLGMVTWFLFLWLTLGLLSYLFPTGKPASRLWRALAWLGAVGVIVAMVPAFLAAEQCTLTSETGESECLVWAMNPLGIAGVPALEYGTLGTLALTLVLISMLGGIVSLTVRFFRSRGVERQQLKWFVVVLGFNVALLIGMDLIWIGLLGWPELPPVPSSIFAFITWTAIPLAIAIAIFKYRLYDIDRIINRALVYAIVVALLGAVFVAGAVWLPTLLPGDSSSIAVAASTLAVAALFNPLRKRAQRFVDHRFYRSRYNAQQVADEFSARLREQVDPDAVTAEWADVVQRTLQPSSVAVWVREGS